MSALRPASTRVWTVAEAKARLSEILRRSEDEGPQRIGARKSFVVVAAAEWDAATTPREALGRWLVQHTPRGLNLTMPERSSRRASPLSEDAGE